MEKKHLIGTAALTPFQMKPDFHDLIFNAQKRSLEGGEEGREMETKMLY